MSIYSNCILPRSICLQFFELLRPYQGRWYNYNLYSANNSTPILLHTMSPISLLEKNRSYYCYPVFEKTSPKYFENKMYIYDNYRTKTSIYLPMYLLPGDILIVNENMGAHYSSLGDISHTDNTFIVLQ